MEDPIHVKELYIQKRMQLLANDKYDRNYLEIDIFHRNLVKKLNNATINKNSISQNNFKKIKKPLNMPKEPYQKVNIILNTEKGKNYCIQNVKDKYKEYRRNIIRNLINKNNLSPRNEITKLIEILKKINTPDNK